MNIRSSEENKKKHNKINMKERLAAILKNLNKYIKTINRNNQIIHSVQSKQTKYPQTARHENTQPFLMV